MLPLESAPSFGQDVKSNIQAGTFRRLDSRREQSGERDRFYGTCVAAPERWHMLRRGIFVSPTYCFLTYTALGGW